MEVPNGKCYAPAPAARTDEHHDRCRRAARCRHESDGVEPGPQLWSLDGAAPSALVRDGWSSKTLKPGDELKLRIEPLRSGAPGGSWSVSKTKLKDGQPVLVSQ